MCLSGSHSTTSTIQNYQATGDSETKLLDLEIHRTESLITQYREISTNLPRDPK